MADVVIDKMYGVGLRLLGMNWHQIPKDVTHPNPMIKHLSVPVTVKVPEGTQAIQVTLTTLDVAFGARANAHPRQLAGLWYEISRPPMDAEGKLVLDGKGECSFAFNAVLQDRSTTDPTGQWDMVFVLQIMAFG
jgi:hypothetical protein